MGVQLARRIDVVGFVELQAAPVSKRRCSNEAKERIVAETRVPCVTGNEAAHWHGFKANQLLSCWALARKRELVVPELAGQSSLRQLRWRGWSRRPPTTSIDLTRESLTVRMAASHTHRHHSKTQAEPNRINCSSEITPTRCDRSTAYHEVRGP